MSGICASVRWDGKPAEHADLAPVLTALATRGPDGSRLAIDGAAILGHSLLATTPEALVETLPLRHTPTGCVITADVRLDNRDELLAQLDLAIAGRVIGDGELILHAYLRWGADCPVHLLGDFAFLIWDPRHQRVFAARDKVGMKQLIYHLDQGRLFA
ncbi:MAG: asparagine synthetase B, partial [Novosphingobium sp.]